MPVCTMDVYALLTILHRVKPMIYNSDDISILPVVAFPFPPLNSLFCCSMTSRLASLSHINQIPLLRLRLQTRQLATLYEQSGTAGPNMTTKNDAVPYPKTDPATVPNPLGEGNFIKWVELDT
jgi:hypothetical protein